NIQLLNKTGDLLWDNDGKTIGDYVRDVEITPGGKYVVAGSSNNFVFLFENGEELWKRDLGSSVRGVGISSQGDYIVAGTSRGVVSSFNRNGDLVWQYTSKKFISDVAIRDQGVVVATRYVDYISDGDIAWNYFPEYGAVDDVGVSLDGELIAAASEKGAYILNKKGQELFAYSSEDIQGGIAISNNGKIAVGEGNKVTRLMFPDIEPPELSVTNPLNGSRVSGVVSITASTNEPLESIRVLIDGNFACGSLPCNWDTRVFTVGEHSIVLIAEDEKGNEAEEEINVFIGEGSNLEFVEKVEEVIDDVKEELISEGETFSESELTSESESELASEDSTRISLPSVRRPRLNIDVSRWTIGAFLLVPAVVFLSRRGNRKKPYRWKTKRKWSILR
ncbi:MAG: PQQ-binding-like beta-propeller repeat protein, partial [Candidatus Hydrothermarchaeales archaeon]